MTDLKNATVYILYLIKYLFGDIGFVPKFSATLLVNFLSVSGNPMDIFWTVSRNKSAALLRLDYRKLAAYFSTFIRLNADSNPVNLFNDD